MHIKKGDTVKIMAGKEKGKTGAVTRVLVDANRIIIEGINTFKKHQRPRQEGQKGEIISVSRSFAASNAMIVCSKCKKAVRTGFRMDGEKKVRICKQCQATI